MCQRPFEGRHPHDERTGRLANARPVNPPSPLDFLKQPAGMKVAAVSSVVLAAIVVTGGIKAFENAVTAAVLAFFLDGVLHHPADGRPRG